MASHFEFVNPAKVPKRVEAAYLCRQRFIAIANNACRNYVVLLIDEAQDLTLREWKWLVGLQNDLDYDGYLLSVFSVGTHQLNYRHEYMASTGNAHVAARFMAAHARFHGLRSVREVEYVLNGYDVDPNGRSTAGCRFWRILRQRTLPAGAGWPAAPSSGTPRSSCHRSRRDGGMSFRCNTLPRRPRACCSNWPAAWTGTRRPATRIGSENCQDQFL